MSAVELISDSTSVKPTLYEGLPEYFSNRSSCVGTLTKNPLTKTIPSLIFAREANPLGSSASVFALSSNSLLLDETILGVPSAPSVTSWISSAGENVNELPESVPCLTYFTKRVSGSSEVSAVDVITCATTPVVLPW